MSHRNDGSLSWKSFSNCTSNRFGNSGYGSYSWNWRSLSQTILWIKTYYDEDVQAEGLTNQNPGWYFWPLAQGDSLQPVGETEVESIAGYAFGPSGLYLKCQY